VFAGRDATRGLAMFKLKRSTNDDPKCCCDLSQRYIDKAKHWDKTFRRQFSVIGYAGVVPGVTPTGGHHSPTGVTG